MNCVISQTMASLRYIIYSLQTCGDRGDCHRFSRTCQYSSYRVTARGSRCGGAGWLLSHAAAWRLLPPSPPRIALARSATLAPSTSRELTSRSIDTDGSPASILATRDWLERRRLANSTCDTARRWRRSRRLRLKASFISMSAASASDRPRNSWTDPTAHPAALSFSRLLFFILPATICQI